MKREYKTGSLLSFFLSNSQVLAIPSEDQTKNLKINQLNKVNLQYSRRSCFGSKKMSHSCLWATADRMHPIETSML